MLEIEIDRFVVLPAVDRVRNLGIGQGKNATVRWDAAVEVRLDVVEKKNPSVVFCHFWWATMVGG